MSRKVCKAGVAGPFSFLIVEDRGSVITSIRKESSEVTSTYYDIDVAEKSIARELDTLIGCRYETE